MANKRQYKVLLVDDDEKTLLLLNQYLISNVKNNLSIANYSTGDDALKAVDASTDFVILDYFLDSNDPAAPSGMDVLQKIKKKNPNAEVVVMSSQQDMETTLELLRKGAYDYIIKGNTAFARAQLIIDGLIEKRESMEKINHYKTGYRYALMACGIFLTLLILAILKAYGKL